MGLSELPDASGAEHEAVFNRLGWITRRRSNHITLTHPNHHGVTLSIPNHRIVKRALLHAQIRRAGLTDALYREVFDAM